MHQSRGPNLAALPRFFVAGGLLSIAACAYAPVSHTVVTSKPGDAATVAGAVDTPRDSNRTIVEVRTYNVSPTVSVIAWEQGEEQVGLRTSIARNGQELPEGSRLSDHRLYISTTAIVEAGGPRRASVYGTELLMGGVMRETHACEGGNCLPVSTYGIRIPDAVLRANRDSLPIKLFTRGDSELRVYVSGTIIGHYLRTVDSVSTALRASATKEK
jgi:hypothetical protein